MYGSLPLLCGACKSSCDFSKQTENGTLSYCHSQWQVCQHKDKCSHHTGFLACDSSVILLDISVQLFIEVDMAHWFVHGAFSGLLFNKWAHWCSLTQPCCFSPLYFWQSQIQSHLHHWIETLEADTCCLKCCSVTHGNMCHYSLLTVQQQECARVVVCGMAVYLCAYQIKDGKMVNIFCILFQTTVLNRHVGLQ